MNAEPAPIVEVFASFQGEGVLVGTPQIFVRFADCDLDCLYCDTEYAKAIPEHCNIYSARGDVRKMPNPLSLHELLVAINEISFPDPNVEWVALTGGEPLLYPEYVAQLASRLSEDRMLVYLETAGHLPEALEQVIEYVDLIAGDIKLPSTMKTPVAYEDIYDFWSVAAGTDAFVKFVITDAVERGEIAGLVMDELWEVIGPLTAVLQPCTPTAAAKAPSFELLWSLAHEADHWFEDVRVIPQCHRLLGAK